MYLLFSSSTGILFPQLVLSAVVPAVHFDRQGLEAALPRDTQAKGDGAVAAFTSQCPAPRVRTRVVSSRWTWGHFLPQNSRACLFLPAQDGFCV